MTETEIGLRMVQRWSSFGRNRSTLTTRLTVKYSCRQVNKPWQKEEKKDQEKQEEVPHPSKGERENHIPDATLSGISPLFESLLSQPNNLFFSIESF